MEPSTDASGVEPQSGLANCNSIYTRMNRSAKKGVWDQVFAKLQEEQILRSTRLPAAPDNLAASRKVATIKHRLMAIPRRIPSTE